MDYETEGRTPKVFSSTFDVRCWAFPIRWFPDPDPHPDSDFKTDAILRVLWFPLFTRAFATLGRYSIILYHQIDQFKTIETRSGLTLSTHRRVDMSIVHAD